MDLSIEKVQVRGLVFDEHGRPVADALVSAVPLKENDASGSTTSDRSGRFAMDALSAGQYRLRAKKGGSGPSSEPVLVVAPTPSDVILVMKAGRRATLRLLSTIGSPLANALVHLRGADGSRHSTTANLEGFASFTLLIGQPEAVVTVYPRGPQAVWSGCVRLTDDPAPTVLEIPEASGTLEVVLKRGASSGPKTLITRFGGQIDTRTLQFERSRHFNVSVRDGDEGTVSYAGMAPGDYAYHAFGRSMEFVGTQLCGTPGPAGVSWTNLPPGGKALISPDKKPK